MLDSAEAAGIVHLLGTKFRWSTGQALATRAIRSGVIGEPRLATFLLQLPTLADPTGEVPTWWGDANEGGGWLGAFASHVIDQIRVTLGEFEALLEDREPVPIYLDRELVTSTVGELARQALARIPRQEP